MCCMDKLEFLISHLQSTVNKMAAEAAIRPATTAVQSSLGNTTVTCRHDPAQLPAQPATHSRDQWNSVNEQTDKLFTIGVSLHFGSLSLACALWHCTWWRLPRAEILCYVVIFIVSIFAVDSLCYYHWELHRWLLILSSVNIHYHTCSSSTEWWILSSTDTTTALECIFVWNPDVHKARPTIDENCKRREATKSNISYYQQHEKWTQWRCRHWRLWNTSWLWWISNN